MRAFAAGAEWTDPKDDTTRDAADDQASSVKNDRTLAKDISALATAFRERRATLEAFSRRHGDLAAIAPATPVLYLFSGCDLLTPVAFRPLASAYTLLAEFIPGTPLCFANATCRKVAHNSVLRFKRHTAEQLVRMSGRPLETDTMKPMFREVGVLPTLIATAALLDMHVVGAVSSKTSVTLYTQRRAAPDTTWSCATITYQGGAKIRRLSDLQPLLDSVQTPFVSFLKGGPHDIMAKPWFVNAVAKRSVAVVQDESGMTSDAMEKAGLQVALYGNFNKFVNEQEEQFAAYAEQLRRQFAARAASIPFCYGYCAGGQNSTALIVAVRKLVDPTPTPRLCIVLATQRSGSSWLTSLLARHPRIFFDRKQESLIDWTQSRRMHLQNGSGAAFHASLEKLWARLVAEAGESGADYVGFKLMWDQVAHPDIAAAFFRARAAFVVLIERRNKLLQLVSSMQSTLEHQFHVHAEGGHVNASLPVDVSRIPARLFVERTHNNVASMSHWAKSWASNARFVLYEDLVTNTSTVLEETFSAMGLDPFAKMVEGNHGMEAFFKVHPDNCAMRIKNAAQLIDALPGFGLECDCLPGQQTR